MKRINPHIMLSRLQRTLRNRQNATSAWYLTIMSITALAGYIYILVFPMLFIYCAYNTFELLPFYPVVENLSQTLMWISLSIFFAHISYQIFSIDLSTITGLRINNKSAGRLFELIKTIQSEYQVPKIKEIIITHRYELKLLKTPRFGIPLFTENALVIGLPVMLTLSPSQFKCLFTRKLTQYSKRRHVICNWLNQLSDSWERYHLALQQQSCIGHQILYWFFTIYLPIYNIVTAPARISDELSADTNALDLVNSEELLSAIQASIIAKLYLDKKYWPQVRNYIVNNPGKAVSPFRELQQTAKLALSQINANDWLQNQYMSNQWKSHNLPTLKQRMQNLGLRAVELPADLTESAGEYFFNSQLAKIISLTDNNWRKLSLALAASTIHNRRHQANKNLKTATLPLDESKPKVIGTH